MRVIISAGGTGGHIYPALAIINKIKEKEPDSDFLYIGTHNRMEKDVIPSYNIKYKALTILGFNRKNIFQNFKTISLFFHAIKESKKIIKEYNPDIVIGVGGYVTGPVIYAAKKLGYPTLIHEQNSIMGLANKFLLKYTDKIAVSFESTLQYIKDNKGVYTGNPCSEDAIKMKELDKTSFGFVRNRKLVLIVMGSLGSKVVNDKMKQMLQLFNNKEYDVLFITGKDYYDGFKNIKLANNIKIVPYVDRTPRIMKDADLMISRAGASMMSEIIAVNIPTIIIPSPYVPNNHQYKNAMDLVSKEAALLIEEKDLNGDILVRTIDMLFHDKEKYGMIKKNLNKLVVKDSATKIYEIAKSLANRK
jgi:UDP-N-acetylglucosamine--N-acetylmuramyl-(pentapeptide) pyrophosphoryl-undecaprenol N-acetylglucosamine transferase